MSWRITITGEPEKLEAFKERHFKKLYSHSSKELILEVAMEETAKEVQAEAKKQGLAADVQEHQDPLEDAEPVDFW